MSGTICICWWHMESVQHKGLQYTFSPCATFNPKCPIGGWILMEIWDYAKRLSVWENLLGMEEPEVPKAVITALRKRVKAVKDIKPWPGED